MGHIHRSSLQKYQDLLKVRFEHLTKQLEGTEADTIMNNTMLSPEEYKKKYRHINPLDLRLAADDFINVLREVKKLK